MAEIYTSLAVGDTLAVPEPNEGSYLTRLQEQFPHIRIMDIPDGILAEYELDRLPRGIAVMGGAARAIVQDIEFGERAPIRDIDLVAIGGLYRGDSVMLDRLSREYMADDYAYGHGVSYEYLDGYFATRDFTFNEVLIIDGKIVISAQGYKDLRDKVVRPTEYESEGWESGIGPKLYYKAKLIEAVFEETYGRGRSEGYSEPYGVEGAMFFLALALNKAFQYGGDVPHLLLEKLGYGVDIDPVHFARELTEHVIFEFRGSDAADEINGINIDDVRKSDEWELRRRQLGRYGMKFPYDVLDEY